MKKPPTTIPHGYGFVYSQCDRCGSLNFDKNDTKSLTDDQLRLEAERIRTVLALQPRILKGLATDEERCWLLDQEISSAKYLGRIDGRKERQQHEIDSWTRLLKADTERDPVEMERAAGLKTFAWPASENGTDEDKIPLDNEGQVRAALSLAQNDWVFRGNRMSPAPEGEDARRIRERILRAAERFNIETDMTVDGGSKATIGELKAEAKAFLASLDEPAKPTVRTAPRKRRSRSTGIATVEDVMAELGLTEVSA